MKLKLLADTLKPRLPEPESADLELRALIKTATSWDANTYFTDPERVLPQAALENLESMVKRRGRGEPLAYILGEIGFMDLMFNVTPDVLVPRPATETLVQAVLDLPQRTGIRLLDLGTGAGTIALSIAAARPDWQLTATDISAAALKVAAANAERNQLQASVDFRRSDWFAAFGDESFDVIVANPPYITTDDPCLSGGPLTFEPTSALDGGGDGMEHIANIIASAPKHISARGSAAWSGWLMLEHGSTQGEPCRALLEGAGFTAIRTLADYSGMPRVSIGQMAN